MTGSSSQLACCQYPLCESSPTLLPENVAGIISAASLATRISLRCSSLVVDAMFEGAKYGTSLSLGSGRNALTSAFNMAKRLQLTSGEENSADRSLFYVVDRCTSAGLNAVHSTLTFAELCALFGLRITSKTIKSGLKAMEEVVRLFDGVFGANETSRAIASFIHLIHHKLMHDPDFELARSGRVAMIAGLTKALTILAVLQSVTHRRRMKQVKTTIVWKGLVIDKDLTNEQIITRQCHNNNGQFLTEISGEDKAALLQNFLEDEDAKHTEHTCADSSMFHVETLTTRTTHQTICVRPLYTNQEGCQNVTETHLVTKEKAHMSYIAVINQPKQPSRRFWRTGLSTLSSWLMTSSSSSSSHASLDQSSPFPSSSQDSAQPLSPTSPNTPSPTKLTETTTPTTWTSSTWTLLKGALPQRISHLLFSSNGLPAASPSVHQLDPGFTSLSRSCSITSMTSLVSLSSMTPNDFRAMSTAISHSLVNPYDLPAQLPLVDETMDPHDEFIKNMMHYMRYASAAYGESFMRLLGIGNIPYDLPESLHDHPNHHAFAHHTGVSVADILLSSYSDYSSLRLQHPSIHPLVHYITVDHDAQAIVLTCRGTLGLSDILTDLTCSYHDFELQTSQGLQTFTAHGGMLEAAQRLADKYGRVFRVVREGLMTYPNYGLVLCGHSLGGGVVSLLSVLWSQQTDTKFVTSATSGLPSGRPIHCYAFGPPCTMSLPLSEYCGQGLVTSIIYGCDFVSGLSLGSLEDLKRVATSLHTEGDVAKKIIARMVGLDQEWSDEDEQWFWAVIQTLRADMAADKLYPPSTVYHIESTPQLVQRVDQTNSQTTPPAHEKAHMMVLTRCDDIQTRFSEVTFSRSMFLDHSPTSYERAIMNIHRGYFPQ